MKGEEAELRSKAESEDEGMGMHQKDCVSGAQNKTGHRDGDSNVSVRHVHGAP